MNNDEFQSRWATALPELRQMVTAYVAVDGWKQQHGDRLAHRLEMIQHAVTILKAAGLNIFPNDKLAANMVPGADVEDVIQWLYYRAYHFAGLAPGGQDADEIQFKPNYMPLVRINAPEWFKRYDFMEWLCADNTATWHKKMHVNITPRGRVSVAKNTDAEDYADVFFTWSGGEGSDHPGTKARPGIPDDIWEFISERIWDELGSDAEVLVWLSNLE